jgi:hypothetical protein
VLSFTTVHTLSACLVATEAEADAAGWGAPPTLLLIHDHRIPLAAVPNLREMHSLEFPLHPDDVTADLHSLPALLHRLATDVGQAGTGTNRATGYRTTLDTVIGMVRASEPDARLLAWAVLYDDVHLSTGRPQQVRRIDAVDTDGRVYQLTRLAGEDHPILTVDDTPDPSDTPATQPGLAALLTATQRFTRPAGGTALA